MAVMGILESEITPIDYSGTVPFLSSEWQELVKNDAPGGGNVFSARSASACIVGKINFARFVSCARYCLGYNVAYTKGLQTFYNLSRTPPIAHPRFPNLYCVKITEEPFAAGVSDDVDGRPVPGNLKNPALIGPNPAVGGAYANYRQSQITLAFETLDYAVLSDQAMAQLKFGGEYQRYTSITADPRIDYLSADGYTLYYAESSPGGTPTSGPPGMAGVPPVGAQIPAAFGQILVKSDVQIKWWRVPSTYLLYKRSPTNILNALGTVNSAQFYDYPPGTLLCLGAKLIRNQWPFALANNPLGVESVYEYDVELIFSYFNPPAGAAVPIQLGHNMQPYRGNPQTVPPDPAAGKWFLATYNGATIVGGGKPLLNSTDFTTIFQSAPWT